MIVTFTDYVEAARRTAKYHGRDSLDQGLLYAALKLAGEAGEVADAVGKAIGRGEFSPGDGDLVGSLGPLREKLRDEAGDVLWQLVALLDELNLNIEDVAEQNIAKLAARAQAGTLLGGNRSGDRRIL